MSKKSNVEQWKTVKGFSEYEVSNRGRVRKGEKILKPYQGTLIVLSRGGKPACRSVGKLVAEAFIGTVRRGTRVHRLDESRPFSVSNIRVGAKAAQ